ncbi:MAG: hypothetical protein JXB60_02955 [Candidatus Cloacimonetes bacterium]|nr:hypothetical protein [Candidatus Cloacimonadota bacterium]
MKTCLIISLFFTATIMLTADPVNVNPDSRGEPWWAGCLRNLTDADLENLAHIPVLTLPSSHRDRPLPPELNNSELCYFRPVFAQEGGSCGQASGVGYHFTYEIDLERDLAATTPVNQYPTHYTWNFLNGGEGYGSWYWDGWDIIRGNGCVNVAEYGDMAYGGERRWLSGYENYHSGMQNRTLEYFTIDVSSPEGLIILKNWMNDHLCEMEYGGLANFAAGVSNYDLQLLPEGTPEAGKSVIVHWSTPVNHALTFVGYNDSIRYDYNGDGHYTNDIDINHDGRVNMQDWEIGGLLVVNSWGLSWADDGKAYMMYKLLADPAAAGGIWNNLVHVLRTRADYSPLLTARALITHDSRDKLRIYAGMSRNLQAEFPDMLQLFPLFNFQGGPYFMRGGDQEYHKLIEIGLDITPLLSRTIAGQPAKFFLIIENWDPDNVGSGEVRSFAVLDYTDGEEVTSPDEHINIMNNDSTVLSVTKIINYSTVAITTAYLPPAVPGVAYNHQLTAASGTPPYTWGIKTNYKTKSDRLPCQTGTDEQIYPSSNDNGYAAIDLDFAFPFFTEEYQNITITTDGSITFNDEFIYVRNPENMINNRTITPCGMDMVINPGQNEGIWYTAEEDQVTIFWKTSQSGAPWTDLEFAARLYSSGKIEFFYIENNTASHNWVAGISRGDNVNYHFIDISGSPAPHPDYHVTLFKPDFPDGMILSPEGIFSGTTNETDSTWNITFLVIDFNNIHALRTLPFAVEATAVGENTIILPVLQQNYPNPFSPGTSDDNPGTTINFSAPRTSRAELAIYSIKGELIRRYVLTGPALFSENSIIWDGLDSGGIPVSSGVYLYRLQAGNINLCRKMILMN